MKTIIKLGVVSETTKALQPYGQVDPNPGCYTFNGVSIVSKVSSTPTFLGETPQRC